MAYNETPRYQNVERPRETSLVHQPVVICVDTSGSMNDPSEDGRTKKDIVEDMLNQLANIDIPEADKAAVDICILVFDDDVRTLVEWRPLTDFEGGLKLDVAGCTSLGSAVIKSIDKTRERRRTYNNEGIASKRAQIFLYTDGVSTEDMTAAYKRADEYLNRDMPSAKMYTILIPPARDPKELAGLGKNVAILAAKDCINGIPATFEFMQASIVAWSASQPGTTIKVDIPDEVGVVNCRGDVTVNPDGSKQIDDFVGDITW